jgi:hypothetical protein
MENGKELTPQMVEFMGNIMKIIENQK